MWSRTALSLLRKSRSHSAETLEAGLKVRKSCEEAAAAFGAQVDVQVSYDYPPSWTGILYYKTVLCRLRERGSPQTDHRRRRRRFQYHGGTWLYGCGLACRHDRRPQLKEKLNLAEFAQTVRIVVTLMTE